MKMTMNGDLFYFNLFLPASYVLGYGTLELALGRFGTFLPPGHSPIPDCYFRLLVLLVEYLC